MSNSVHREVDVAQMRRIKHLPRGAHLALPFGHTVLAQSRYSSASRFFVLPALPNERNRAIRWPR